MFWSDGYINVREKVGGIRVGTVAECSIPMLRANINTIGLSIPVGTADTSTVWTQLPFVKATLTPPISVENRAFDNAVRITTSSGRSIVVTPATKIAKGPADTGGTTTTMTAATSLQTGDYVVPLYSNTSPNVTSTQPYPYALGFAYGCATSLKEFDFYSSNSIMPVVYAKDSAAEAAFVSVVGANMENISTLGNPLVTGSSFATVPGNNKVITIGDLRGIHIYFQPNVPATGFFNPIYSDAISKLPHRYWGHAFPLDMTWGEQSANFWAGFFDARATREVGSDELEIEIEDWDVAHRLCLYLDSIGIHASIGLMADNTNDLPRPRWCIDINDGWLARFLTKIPLQNEDLTAAVVATDYVWPTITAIDTNVDGVVMCKLNMAATTKFGLEGITIENTAT